MSTAANTAKIQEAVARQRAYFQTGASAARWPSGRPALKRLKREMQAREQIPPGRPPGRPAQVPL